MAEKKGNEDMKGAGAEASKRAYGHQSSEVLHQRRKLPLSLLQMAVAGFFIVGAVGYFTLYAKAKPDATARDVAKVATGSSDDDRNRRSK